MSTHRSDRILDALVAGFAAWTLSAHGVVAWGGGLRALVLLGAPSALAATALWLRAVPAAQSRPGGAAPRDPGAAPPGLRAAVLGAAALCSAALAVSGLVAFWVGAALLLGFLTARELRAPGEPAPGPPGRGHGPVLLAAALLCAGVALVAHRPDGDDAFLLNLAVAAADRPDAAILARDSLHGLPGPPAGVPAGLPLYRLHSLELLEAALAWLTPLRAVDVAHLVIPACAAFAVPFVYARLLRLLLPGRWLWAVLAALGWLLCVGDTHVGYGNLAFVRLQQGKAILLTAGVPLLIARAVEFALEPGRARWLGLAALEIACIGLSATALWLAPVVAGVALLAAAPWQRRGAARLLAGGAASLYPLGAGAALLAGTRGALDALAYGLDRDTLAERALELVLGSGPASLAALWAVLAGWSLCSSTLGRRLALLFPLAFLALWNPWLAPWIADHLTSEPAYWRVFWMLPVPVFVAIAVTAPLGPPPLRGSRRLGAAASLGLALALFGFAPGQQVLSAGNRVRLDRPGPKAPPDAYAVARALARRLGPGGVALAPHRVSTWLPTLHAHPFPLAARPEYVMSLRGALGPGEVRRRVALTSLASGGGGAPARALLAAALEARSLDAVCLAPEALRPELTRLLEDAGWTRVERVEGHEIWMPGRARAGD